MTLDDLTPREAQLARLVAAGMSQKEVAKVMGLRPHTVNCNISKLAQRIPGTASPMRRISLWYHHQLFPDARVLTPYFDPVK